MVELKDPDIWPLTFLASISSSSGAAKSPLAIRLSKMGNHECRINLTH